MFILLICHIFNNCLRGLVVSVRGYGSAGFDPQYLLGFFCGREVRIDLREVGFARDGWTELVNLRVAKNR